MINYSFMEFILNNSFFINSEFNSFKLAYNYDHAIKMSGQMSFKCSISSFDTDSNRRLRWYERSCY